MFDEVCPFLRGAYRVFGITTRISETATGERPNHYQKHEEGLQLCKRTDIVAVDNENLQNYLAEYATLQETDVWKRMESRWRFARSSGHGSGAQAATGQNIPAAEDDMVRVSDLIPRTTCSPPKPKQRAKKP
ncbi:hypothetical protein BGZ76_002448 [Entomortierella beljakovae]|nr:hypothetical protein BGZ76_002448 [Entomortierella beljakovae]